MQRVAVFVDAGYLFAAGSNLVFGERLRREETELDLAIVQALEEEATRIASRELLRIYWYDGAQSGPSAEQAAIAYHENTKLRLGYLNSYGQQKGVDSLLVTDMITLARNRAMSDAVLISGDEDTRVGVLQAQEFGVRVHLLGVSPNERNQSNLLLQESDTCQTMSEDFLRRFLRRKQSTNQQPKQSLTHESDPAEVFQNAAQTVLATLNEDEIDALARLITNGEFVPKANDGHLLKSASLQLDRKLHADETRVLRQVFRELVLKAAAESSD